MDFLNLPSAAQIERLTRRVRSVSQRLEAIEDALSRLEHALEGSPAAVATRLDAIEAQLADARELLAGLADARAGGLARPGAPARRTPGLSAVSR